MTRPLVGIPAPSPTNNGETYRGTVNQLPISTGDPVWVGQDGADDDTECFLTDDIIAQVGDRVLYVKEGRYGIIIGKIAAQPIWTALAGTYGTSIADFGPSYDVGAYIKLGSIVYLRGLIKATAAVSAGATVLTMPTGCGMAPFDTNGSMFAGGHHAAGASVSPLRWRLVSYQLKIDNALASGDSVGLTGLSWPADI